MRPVKTYKLHARRPKKHDEPPINRVKEVKTDEGLTGFVMGWEASDIEERFARALAKKKIPFSFREHFFAPTRTTAGAIEVDFLVNTGGTVYPIFVDGEFAHKTSAQKTNDKIKDAIFDNAGMSYGFNPSQRIPGDELGTQDEADDVVKEKF